MVQNIGTNVADYVYSSAEQPFLNIFKCGQCWATIGAGGSPTGEEDLLYSSFLDSNLYPTRLVGGAAHTFTQVATTLCKSISATSTAPFYKTGQYIFLYDGTGTFTFGGDATYVSGAGTGRIVLDVTPSNAGITVFIATTDPSVTGDYVRNIRLVNAAYEALLLNGEVFSPDFISRIQPFKAVRFMRWMDMYNNNVANWSDRVLPSHAFYAQADTTGNRLVHPIDSGIPAEHQIALCNKMGAHAWFNLPILATDTYMSSFATLAHSTLSSNLNAYVEYGNEMWASTAGTPWSTLNTQMSAVLSGGPYSVSQTDNAANAIRGTRMAALWKAAWGTDAARCLTVYGPGRTSDIAAALNQTVGSGAGQLPYTGANPWVGKVSDNFDVITFDDYFSNFLSGNVPNTFTQDQFFNEMFIGTSATQMTIDGSTFQGYLADCVAAGTHAFNLIRTTLGISKPIVAYEAGQGFQNLDVTLQAIYQPAQTDPRMGTAYTSKLASWKSLTSDGLWMHYTLCTAQTQFGYWGALENILQTTSVKYAALIAAINPGGNCKNLRGDF